MAKTNPFIKGLSQAELAKLRRKAPYVDQVYNPETNEVNYDIILRRLNDTTKKVSDVEQIFLNQVKRNLQREYWRQTPLMLVGEHPTNRYGYHNQLKEPDTLSRYWEIGKKTVADPAEGFDNYVALKYALRTMTGREAFGAKIGQFMPEDFNRYRGTLWGANSDTIRSHLRPPTDKLPRTFPQVENGRYGDDSDPERYYFEKGLERNFPAELEEFVNKASSKLKRDQNFFSLLKNAAESRMHTLETYFNRINEGISKVNKAFADRKEQERIEKEQALNRAIKAEAAVASYQRKEKFDREQFDRALADKDKAYNERFEQANAEFKKLIDARDTAYKAETAKRTAEFDSWRKSFESSSIEQAKRQAEQHTKEMSQLRAESIRQAQDLANAKVENERIKSQNAILLKNNTRRRIALKQMGNIGLNFVGAAQRDSQSTALLSVLAGKNRYVPVARRFNEYGRFVESRGDTAVPDTFLSLISPQPQNRSKK